MTGGSNPPAKSQVKTTEKLPVLNDAARKAVKAIEKVHHQYAPILKVDTNERIAASLALVKFDDDHPEKPLYQHPTIEGYALLKQREDDAFTRLAQDIDGKEAEVKRILAPFPEAMKEAIKYQVQVDEGYAQHLPRPGNTPPVSKGFGSRLVKNH